jgi:hypothetical protein
MVPAEREFFFVDEAVGVLIEDLEDVARAVFLQRVDMAFVVAEQSLADQTKLLKAQLAIPG